MFLSKVWLYFKTQLKTKFIIYVFGQSREELEPLLDLYCHVFLLGKLKNMLSRPQTFQQELFIL